MNKQVSIKIVISHTDNHKTKLYAHGYQPIVRVDQPSKSGEWGRLCRATQYEETETGIILTFSFEFTKEHSAQSIIYFAFSYPFSLEDYSKKMTALEARLTQHSPCRHNDPGSSCTCKPETIYLCREVLVKSIENRPVELLTVTSCAGMGGLMEAVPSGLFPDGRRSRIFSGKKASVMLLGCILCLFYSLSYLIMNGCFLIKELPMETTSILTLRLCSSAAACIPARRRPATCSTA
jgi:hypothetical protein